ncbi:MAG: hypothetical protein IPK16_03275 [Anaerolineales bacterium]|nr:hypothetical protein [Anaerolineales bacterium]
MGEVGPGQVVNLVATSEDGGWYLLDNGAWIANFLVDPAPTALPVATQEIIDLVQGRATLPLPQRPLQRNLPRQRRPHRPPRPSPAQPPLWTPICAPALALSSPRSVAPLPGNH